MDIVKYSETASSSDGMSGSDHGASGVDLEAAHAAALPQPSPQHYDEGCWEACHQRRRRRKLRKNTLLKAARRLSIVLRTSLVVAAVAAATNGLPCQQLRADMLAGTIIFMVGDWGAQFLTHARHAEGKTTCTCWRSFEMDSSRFVISAVLGCFWGGICNPSVYTEAEYLFPGRSVQRILTKMAFSVSILSTGGNYTTMIFRRFFRQWWEARTAKVGPILRACVQSCNRDMLEVLKVDLRIWPL